MTYAMCHPYTLDVYYPSGPDPDQHERTIDLDQQL